MLYIIKYRNGIFNTLTKRKNTWRNVSCEIYINGKRYVNSDGKATWFSKGSARSEINKALVRQLFVMYASIIGKWQLPSEIVKIYEQDSESIKKLVGYTDNFPVYIKTSKLK